MYAERYNARKPPKKVDFLAAYVLELVEREGEPICGVESFIDGDYKKYNNNWDWSDDQRNTPQAFSHFTWEASNNRLLICDIQVPSHSRYLPRHFNLILATSFCHVRTIFDRMVCRW